MLDEAKYRKLASELDDLIDQVGENELHPLSSVMEDLSLLIVNYENFNVSELVVSS